MGGQGRHEACNAVVAGADLRGRCEKFVIPAACGGGGSVGERCARLDQIENDPV